MNVSFSSWKQTSFSLVLKLLRWRDWNHHCEAAVAAREQKGRLQQTVSTITIKTSLELMYFSKYKSQFNVG